MNMEKRVLEREEERKEEREELFRHLNIITEIENKHDIPKIKGKFNSSLRALFKKFNVNSYEDTVKLKDIDVLDFVFNTPLVGKKSFSQISGLLKTIFYHKKVELTATENEKTDVDSLKGSLNRVEMIGNSRPHQYEHEHFMFIEEIARYIIKRDTIEEE